VDHARILQGDFTRCEAPDPAPTDKDSHVLCAVDGIRNGPGNNTALRGSRPQFRAGVGSESLELAESQGLKNEVPRGRQISAVHRSGMIPPPCFGLFDRAPSDEMALDAAKNRFLDLRILRKSSSDKVNAIVEGRGGTTEVLGRFVGEV